MTDLTSLTAKGDRGNILRGLRDRLGADIDACTSTRDLPALVRQLTDVLQQIEDLPEASGESIADQIAAKREQRRTAVGQ